MAQNDRDTSVELTRIVGCLIVIGCHTVLPYASDTGWDASRTFIAMLFADGVSIFFMITGFFLYDARGYGRIITRSIWHVLVPAFVVSILALFAVPIMDGTMTVQESVLRPLPSYAPIVRSLLTWNNWAPGQIQLWYVYVYALLILVWPVTARVDTLVNTNSKNTKRFILITTVLLLINDYTCNQLFEFSHHSINGLVPAAMVSIWGHVLYKNKAKLNKIPTLAFLLLFLAINVARTWIQLHRAAMGLGDNTILCWYSLGGVICASTVYVVLSRLDSKIPTSIRPIISKIGSMTLGVYLVHVFVRDILGKLGFIDWLATQLIVNNGFASELLYSFCIVMVVFALSLAITGVASAGFACLKKLTHIAATTSAHPESMK